MSHRNRAFKKKLAARFSQFSYGSKLTHASVLDKFSLAALSSGEVDIAFRLIDRRCRITPPPSAYHHILRAEILARKGERLAALGSILDALDLAPEDIQANRRMLTWGKGEQRIQAAKVLCESDDEISVLIEAAKVLRRAGRSAIGTIRVFDTYVRGWAAWDLPQAPELVVFGADLEQRHQLEGDAQHVLKKAGFQNCASFEWSLDIDEDVRTARLQRIHLQSGGQVVLSRRVSNKASHPRSSPRVPLTSTNPEKRALTIIIPIYRDLEATRACLESVSREIVKTPRCEVVIVNDASPEPGMAPYLEGMAKKLKTRSTKVSLLTNSFNMGFVGSVNRALALTDNSDIILLNADTIVPDEAFIRLAKTARENERIGTITPLSNNGEFTSFPISLRANPMPSVEDLAVLDRVAARVNKGKVIDIPSGIGFCLFISAECFEAVGGLSDSFQGGYLEDVDFCLRARERGFRNVCDPSVFVAHAGSRSFLADKRNLVIRNLPIIEERFPNDRFETRGFLDHDPLQAARAAIEREMTANAICDVLIVVQEGIVKAIAEERAAALRAKGSQVWFAIVAGAEVLFVNTADAMPRSLKFRADQRGQADFCAFLQNLTINRIEVTNPFETSHALLTILAAHAQHLDLFIADGGWLLNQNLRETTQGQGAQKNLASLAKAAGKAAKLIVPCEEAKAFVQCFLPDRMAATVLEKTPKSKSRALAYKRQGESQSPTCGIICLGRLSDDFNLIREIAMKALRRTKRSSFVVLGETFNDAGLWPLDNIFITAAIERHELKRLCKFYEIDKLFLATRRPLFGHPMTAQVHKTGLPVSYFDWSFGTCEPAHDNLALDPTLETIKLAPKLFRWLGWV